jgi:hypothetical protein
MLLPSWIFSLAAKARQLPAIAYVILFAVSLLGAAGYGLYQRGEQRGAQRVTRAARADTTRRAIATVDTATQATDRSVARAAAQRTRSDVGRTETRRAAAAVAELRGSAAVVAALDSTPTPVVELVTAQAEQLARDSVQIARDSMTIALHVVALDSAHRERLARAALDTARKHQQDDKPPDAPTGRLGVVVGSVGGAAIGAAVGGPLGAAAGATIGGVMGLLLHR